MSNHFGQYLESLTLPELKSAVVETRNTFRKQVLDDYDDTSDQQVLLYGDVQSGKTSHMLGVVADCLDRGIQTVIILTSPNTRLVSQTYDRVFKALSGVLVCRSDSTNEFRMNQDRTTPQQTVIVAGKIPSTLNNWLRVFSETKALRGNPILIVDDEADATSLNTLVNDAEVSRINRQLTELRHSSTGCLYLQVTGTPQAILLQTELSGWVARRAVHFRPGDAYVGGELFFNQVPNPYTRTFANSEAAQVFNLREAVLTHMVTSAMFKSEGKKLCNMMVHPSHRTPTHRDYKEDVEKIVDDVFSYFEDDSIQPLLERVYNQLVVTHRDALPYDEVVGTLRGMKDEFNYLIINADNKTQEKDWATGYNFIVGGNSLGRGLTFKFLQTVFYVRESKRPQADTVWQHARMFGYERHIPTLRWFLPGPLAKMFTEVHQGNEVLKMQLESGTPLNELRIVLGPSISPTRSKVLHKQRISSLSGGVNYFAGDPLNVDFERLDERLNKLVHKHGDDFHLSTRAVSKLTDEFETESDDLDLATFRVALQEFAKTKPHLTARVVIRTKRRVNHGKGTLLSPNDQELARTETTHPLLILYRIEGVNEIATAKGESTWARDPIWVPNIKLPGSRQYWRVE